MIAVIYITLVMTHFLAAATLFFISTLIYFNDPKHATNRALVLLVVGSILWIIADFVTLSTLPQDALLWARLTVLISVVNVFLLVRFITVFPRSSFKTLSLPNLFILISLLVSLLIAFFGIQGVDLGKTALQEGIPFLVTGGAWFVWKVIFTATFLLVVYLAIRKWRSMLREERNKWSGIILGLISAYAVSLVLQYSSAVDFFVYNIFSYIPLILCIGYSILKYRAFRIKIIVSELLVFVVWLFIIVRMFFDSTFQEFLTDLALLVASVLFGLVLVNLVLREVKQQEDLKTLGAELLDLRSNLEAKIVVQRDEVRRAYEIE